MNRFDANPLDQDALLHLLKQQTPQQGGGAVIRKPVIESDSVLDSTADKYWKKFQRLIGGDDPNAVMIGGAMEVPGGAPTGITKALRTLLKKAKPFEDDVYHVTTPENAAGIAREGFQLRKAPGLGGDDFGPGVYLADRFGESVGYWRNQLETKNPAGTVATQALKGRVKLAAPLVLEDMPPHAGSSVRPSYPDQLRRAGAADLIPAFEEKLKRGLSRNAALGEVAREAGHDGLRIIRRGGDEIIAFDPKAVAWKP